MYSIIFALGIISLCVLCMCAGSDIRHYIYMNSNYTDQELRRMSNRVFIVASIIGLIAAISNFVMTLYS